ncbi:MAG: hypothetical protein IT287_09645 [Bdellovibrionaceae bacterium]|nr:hypothetical protein [Pseudobdellovibrionaceae bacterium]
MFFLHIRYLIVFFLIAVASVSVYGQTCSEIFAASDVASLDVFPELRMIQRYEGEGPTDRNEVYYVRTPEARAKYEWKVANGVLMKFKDGKWLPLTTAVSVKDHRYDPIQDTPLVEFVVSVKGQVFGMTRDEQMRAYEETGLPLHHSTFLAGKPVGFAGNMIVKNGKIAVLDNTSGHYTPGVESLLLFLTSLKNKGVDLQSTYIRLDHVTGAFKNAQQVRDLETFMPEIILVEAAQKVLQGRDTVLFDRTAYLNKIESLIESEFKKTGDSRLLRRADFVWLFIYTDVRELLTQLAARHNLNLRDLQYNIFAD